MIIGTGAMGQRVIKFKSNFEYINAIRHLRRYADGFEAHDADGNVTHFAAEQWRDPLVNPLTRAERLRVRKYYDVLQRHAGYKGARFQKFRTTDPVTGKRVPNKKKLSSAQKAMGMPSKGKWRGVFVPQPDENIPARLAQRKGIWVIEYPHQGVDTMFVPFDREEFALYGTSYVRGLLHDLPVDYRYNLDMGYGRNRWKAGGNLEQMLRDLDRIVMGYGHYVDFVLGVHIYRGGKEEYNDLKRATFRGQTIKRAEQEKIKKIIAKERRRKITLERDERDARREVQLLEKFKRRYNIK